MRNPNLKSALVVLILVAGVLAIRANGQSNPPTPADFPTPADTLPADTLPAWPDDRQQAEAIPGIYFKRMPMPRNLLMSTEQDQLTLPSRLRAKYLRELSSSKQ